MATFEHHAHPGGGEFTYEDNDRKLAEMVYFTSRDHILIIDHTNVAPSLKGQGIGKQLLGNLVEYVRQNNMEVIAFCPFANATFQKTPEWQDVLSQSKLKPLSRFGIIRDLYNGNIKSD